MSGEELQSWNKLMNFLILCTISAISGFMWGAIYFLHAQEIELSIFFFSGSIVAAFFLFVPIQAKIGRNAYFRKV